MRMFTAEIPAVSDTRYRVPAARIGAHRAERTQPDPRD